MERKSTMPITLTLSEIVNLIYAMEQNIVTEGSLSLTKELPLIFSSLFNSEGLF